VILSQNREDIQTAIRERVAPPEKLVYLGNGIDLERFDPARLDPNRLQALRAELGLQPGRPVIGFVARLVREKGVLEFLQAVKILKSAGIQAHYLTTGSPQTDKTTAVSPVELLKQHGLEEEVQLLGQRDDIPELLGLMDLVVLPSYAEGIPRILMEAAAMGKPVVASRVRGNIEVVEDGQTGHLVPVRDGPALAEGIKKTLSADPMQIAEMGRLARQRAARHFDERLYFYRTDHEYRRLIQAKLRLEPDQLLLPVPEGPRIPHLEKEVL
jgi:glycosyltransferase involved in cell wall biosynthesis